MLTPTAEQLTRYANDVAVLWDEAQDNPALLRFLSPFGRPDFGRLSRKFRSSSSVTDLIAEGYPAFATWLATMVLRDGLHPAVKLDTLIPPRWDNAMMTPTIELTTGVQLGGSQLRTLVVAGSLKAPMVLVRDARLVVAGDLETKLLVADGCALVGGAVKADVVACPASRLSEKDRPDVAVRPLGFQVGREVSCRIFDSPRFGLSCPVKAEIVVHGVGLPATADARDRLREVLVPGAVSESGLELVKIAELISRGQRVFT